MKTTKKRFATRRTISKTDLKLGRAHVVGPAARKNELDDLDPDEKKEYQGVATALELLVDLSKRVKAREAGARASLRLPGARRKLKRDGKPIPDESQRFQMRKRAAARGELVVGLGGARRRIRKDLDDGARPAPSTTGSDQDVDSRVHDFVDDIMDPPYPFDILASLYENSGPLRRNVDGMAANIDGFGYRFEPVLDFSHPEVTAHIQDLMFLQRVDEDGVELTDLDEDKVESLVPKLSDVKKRRKLWERIATIERHRLHAFFEALHPRFSFTRLRIEMRENLELFGNAGWEILREKRDDVYSKIEQAYNVPFASIRLVRQDKVPTPVKVKVRVDAVRWDELVFQRYFRRFVRITGNVKVYYKEFGDPRVVSQRTGRYYSSVEELWKEEGPETRTANEFLHFTIPSLLSPYGIARWMGALLAVLGNRAAEEVNYLYFDNKAIPPMVLLVSGGRLSESSVERIQSFLEERLKGRENFHKVLVIEGVPADAKETDSELEPSGKLRLDIKPLTSEMLQDGLFQDYDDANELKIGRAFRQPPLLTGDQRDANRSTADVVKGIAEEQVYQPARDMFDADMDRLFLSNLGIRFWHFKTNAPVQRIPNDLVANACKAVAAGIIDPNEGRALLADAFSKEFPHRPEDWAKMPPALAVAAAKAAAQGGEDLETAESQAAEDDRDPAENAGEEPKKPAAPPTGAPGQPPPKPGTPKGAVVPAQKGEVLARGRTTQEAGHTHAFVVTLDGKRARIVTAPGPDGHVHAVEVVPYRAGGTVSEALDPVDGHEHEVRFRFPSTKRQARAKALASALLHVASNEVEKLKSEFFDSEVWEDKE